MKLTPKQQQKKKIRKPVITLLNPSGFFIGTINYVFNVTNAKPNPIMALFNVLRVFMAIQI